MMRQTEIQAERNEFITQVLEDDSISLTVPSKLSNPDPIVKDLILAFSNKGKSEFFVSGGKIHSPENSFLLSVTEENLKRALLILDTFIKAAKGRGHSFDIKGHKTTINIGSQKLELRFWEKSKYTFIKDPNWSWDRREISPTGKLSFQYFDIFLRNEWSDTPKNTLESKLGRILGSLEFISKQETIKWAEIKRWNSEYKKEQDLKIKLEEKKKEEQIKFLTLIGESDKWNKAQQIRSYINQVELNLKEYSNLKENLSEWIYWAKAKADWLDPLTEKSDEFLDGFNPFANNQLLK